MKSMKFIGCLYLLALLSACGSRTSDYDATGTFEATEVLVSAEASGKLLYFHVEEGTRLKAGEEVGLIDTLQLYLKKLQLRPSNEVGWKANVRTSTNRLLLLGSRSLPPGERRDAWKTC